MSKPRWYQKPLPEIGKHDWKKATWANPDWKRNAILPKVTGILCDLYNPEDGFAYPSLDFIASELNLPEQKISPVISMLRNVGAIKKVHRKDVPANIAPKKGERGLFLELNFMWAYEMAERIRNPRFAKGEEPAWMKAGKAKKQPDASDAKFTMTVKNSFTMTVKDKVHYDSEVDTDGGYIIETPNGSRRTEGAFSVRDTSSGPFSLTPPSDPAEARAWLQRICVDRSKLSWALGLLAKNQLTPEIIKDLAA